MDASDPAIALNDTGVCNHCLEASIALPSYKYTEAEEDENLSKLKVRLLKKKVGEYDSIIGLSGGVDSSYVAYLAMEMGLNPLCVHFDNGWNSEIAVKNIRNIINVTKFDLYTYVIDWPEFRDLQRSFFRAGVVDIEMLTDHAIFASLFKIRRQHKITNVLTGTNYVTEHGMPASWGWPKMDKRNILTIHKKFGEKKLKTYPAMSSFWWVLMRRFGVGGTYEAPLNLVNYSKNDVMDKLKEVFSWQYYGGKHYESVFTKFYQAYVLPTKFGIDKRRTHLSALIRNGELTREEAAGELQKPLYSKADLSRDRAFVLKKLGFSEAEFETIMNEPPIPHDFYSTDQTYMRPLMNLGEALIGRGE